MAHVEIPSAPEGFAERTLCPDGTCTGIVGPDGICVKCGKAVGTRDGKIVPKRGVSVAEDDKEKDDFRGREPNDRRKKPADGKKDDGFDPHRLLCIDGACIGVVGADGCCKVCGKRHPRA